MTGPFLLGAEPERLPAQPGTRPAECLALWWRWTVAVRLRRRARALVLATAGPPRDSTGRLHDGRRRTGSEDREVLRAAVHRLLRAQGRATRPPSGPHLLETLDEMLPSDGRAPLSVRTLRWMFLTSRHRARFRSLAARLLGSSRG